MPSSRLRRPRAAVFPPCDDRQNPDATPGRRSRLAAALVHAIGRSFLNGIADPIGGRFHNLRGKQGKDVRVGRSNVGEMRRIGDLGLRRRRDSFVRRRWDRGACSYRWVRGWQHGRCSKDGQFKRDGGFGYPPDGSCQLQLERTERVRRNHTALEQSVFRLHVRHVALRSPGQSTH